MSNRWNCIGDITLETFWFIKFICSCILDVARTTCCKTKLLFLFSMFNSKTGYFRFQAKYYHGQDCFYWDLEKIWPLIVNVTVPGIYNSNLVESAMSGVSFWKFAFILARKLIIARRRPVRRRVMEKTIFLSISRLRLLIILGEDVQESCSLEWLERLVYKARMQNVAVVDISSSIADVVVKWVHCQRIVELSCHMQSET